MSNFINTGKEYLALESTPLPFHSKKGDIQIDYINLDCPECNSNVEYKKYKIVEFENCVEVNAVGICIVCKIIVNGSKFRWYFDGRCHSCVNGVWYDTETIYIDSWLYKVKMFFKTLFKRDKEE